MRTLYRARVVTMGHPAEGEWILIDDRHVQRVGVGEPPAADRIVELPGATILPGFTDAHVHLSATALHGRHPAIAAADSRAALVAAARGVANSEDLAGIGFGFDESDWDDPTLPTIDELDALTSEPLIIVRTDVHLSLANTGAMQAADVLGLKGVERDPHGAPTGVLTEAANDEVLRWYTQQLSDAQLEGLQLEAAALAASRGVTCVHEMAIPRASGTRDIDVLLGHRARLPVQVVPYVATMDIGWVLEMGLRQIGGDMSLDGSLGAHTAHLSQPYEDRPGSNGVAYFEDAELIEFLRDAHAAGLQVAMHVIGDAAIEQALRAWEVVDEALDSRLRRHFRSRRHRLEHAELPTHDQLERAAALGLSVSVQPAFDSAWGGPGGLYEQRLGSQRAWAANPFRTMQERGLEIGIGSDAPVTPLDPMAAIWALENHHDPAQRWSRADAIRLAIQGGTRISPQQHKGQLEPGFHADLVAFDHDPRGAEDLRALRPVLTVSLGREVFLGG